MYIYIYTYYILCIYIYYTYYTYIYIYVSIRQVWTSRWTSLTSAAVNASPICQPAAAWRPGNGAWNTRWCLWFFMVIRWRCDSNDWWVIIHRWWQFTGGDWNHGIWWLSIGWDPTDELHHCSEGLKPPIRWCLWFFMVIQWGLNGDLLMFNVSFSWRRIFFWTKPPSNWWIIIRNFSDCGNMHQQKLGVLMTKICKHGDLTRKRMEFI